MAIEKWYETYRNKIKKAKSDGELDMVIDEIFEEGVEQGRDEGYEREYDDISVDLD